ncbi:hypothetical protein TTHERM_00664050 (macronuclear) [Tetrahymena thermophila SB210]|uniref:Uncharacterized protein n=1 Tax=Tetrahymena thermophila (strain SB210) TaxID=312017 RepID=I7M8X0_TETTS|nr:hypothetical protein TTHERM_00664050 [Tetrahymena thermophila SB210]EAR99926.2 hypothetical protein TTHERM_00664050 [Tetrahymena thermophila SB210]|eukprot:XP_001020171.2 hypothetical protein TTHERM_00664050 [Tetrahymena thermophila SB210]
MNTSKSISLCSTNIEIQNYSANSQKESFEYVLLSNSIEQIDEYSVNFEYDTEKNLSRLNNFNKNAAGQMFNNRSYIQKSQFDSLQKQIKRKDNPQLLEYKILQKQFDQMNSYQEMILSNIPSNNQDSQRQGKQMCHQQRQQKNQASNKQNKSLTQFQSQIIGQDDNRQMNQKYVSKNSINLPKTNNRGQYGNQNSYTQIYELKSLDQKNQQQKIINQRKRNSQTKSSTSIELESNHRKNLKSKKSIDERDSSENNQRDILIAILNVLIDMKNNFHNDMQGLQNSILRVENSILRVEKSILRVEKSILGVQESIKLMAKSQDKCHDQNMNKLNLTLYCLQELVPKENTNLRRQIYAGINEHYRRLY